MKRFFITFAILVTIYVIYIDLNEGTLSSTQKQEPSLEVQASPEDSSNFFEQKVQSGDTVLSIVEQYSTGGISVSLETVVKDFQQLNDGLKPEDIQIGKTYIFPIYK
ncbi:LysM peptidoglycan-binding domain-containing protein [Niallia sp. FSL W8-0635]|uniref:LysM peptidoglycan-binding domain-containing protein n=1 Tax=Niallia sp. FSL W8-0635 TaxID=2975337 RepID=UPI002B018943|nr:LysM peptidoglycan-binding domain-containing protein [Yersinia enterocolitica]